MAGSWCTAPTMSLGYIYLGYISLGSIYWSEMFRSIHMRNLKVFDTCGQIALKMAPVYTPRQSSSAMGDPPASHNRLQRNRWYHLCPPPFTWRTLPSAQGSLPGPAPSSSRPQGFSSGSCPFSVGFSLQRLNMLSLAH